MGVKIKTHSRYYGPTWSSKLQSLLSGDKIQMYWMLNKLHSSEGFECLRVTVWVRVRGSERKTNSMPLIFHTLDWGGNLLAIIDDTWPAIEWLACCIPTLWNRTHRRHTHTDASQKESKTLLPKISRVYRHALWEQLNSSTCPHENTFVHMPACTCCHTWFHLNQAAEGKRVLQ